MAEFILKIANYIFSNWHGTIQKKNIFEDDQITEHL